MIMRIFANAIFLVVGFLIGCGEYPVPEAPHKIKVVKVVKVETFPALPEAKVANDVDFKGLDDFKSLGIPEGWGE